MSFSLRPYQHSIIDETRALMLSGIRSILIQSPTGSGKTALTAHMLKTAASKGMASWFCVHRRELVKQSIRAFSNAGVNYGVVSAGFMPDFRHLVQICSVQTVARKVGKPHLLKTPRLLVFDEAHHIAAGSWSKIHAAFPDAFIVGLTATPMRLDGKGLDGFFKKIVLGPKVQWLIENKFLADYKLYAPSTVNLAGIHTRMGDYAIGEVSKVVDKPSITGDAIKHYMKHAAGKRAVVFCASVEHSKHVSSQFIQAGIPAAHVDGETDIQVRDEAIRRFENGDIKILSNVELFGEGFDLPALEVAILLRPTQSLGLYLQQVGRALRPSPGKSEAIILDHVGNCSRHGLPDEDRVWTLSGRTGKRGSAGDGSSVRICPKCFAAQFVGAQKCKHCGFVFEVVAREVEQKEGELEEVDVEVIRRQKKSEQGAAQTLEDLIALGKKRGYKKPYAWAHHILKARGQRVVTKAAV